MLHSSNGITDSHCFVKNKRTSRISNRLSYRRKKFHCLQEQLNVFSENAIVVKSRRQVIGHVPEALAKVFQALIKDGIVRKITAKITGDARTAPEGTWIQGGGIELPCKYKLYGDRKYKNIVKDALK